MAPLYGCSLLPWLRPSKVSPWSMHTAGDWHPNSIKIVAMLLGRCSGDSRNGMNMSPDRRRSPRIKTQIEATVVCQDGLQRIPATVVDQSSAGVRIRMDDDEAIAQDCYLLFGHRMEPFKVVWRASRSAGLAFTA